MVLLDRLVERGLAKQQEAEANPHGQQPGHGKAESAGRRTVGKKQQENRGRVVIQHVSININNTHTHAVFAYMCQTKRNTEAHWYIFWYAVLWCRSARMILSKCMCMAKNMQEKKKRLKQMIKHKFILLISILPKHCCSLRRKGTTQKWITKCRNLKKKK